jgi:hypothetical protein
MEKLQEVFIGTMYALCGIILVGSLMLAAAFLLGAILKILITAAFFGASLV